MKRLMIGLSALVALAAGCDADTLSRLGILKAAPGASVDPSTSPSVEVSAQPIPSPTPSLAPMAFTVTVKDFHLLQAPYEVTLEHEVTLSNGNLLEAGATASVLATLRKGGTVTFVNEDTTSHRFLSAIFGNFDETGQMDNGVTVNRKLNKVGLINFGCQYHGEGGWILVVD